MVFTDAKTVIIDEKEVKSIVLQDGGVLYEKENLISEPLVVHFVGTNFSSPTTDPFTGSNIIIDWGDGTITNYTSGDAFAHTYEDNIEHIIRISNVTEIKQQAFYDTNLTKLFVPSNITSLGAGAFTNCQSLGQIVLSEGLKSMGFSCFAICGNEDNLMDITIPFSVTSIDIQCFSAVYITKMNFLWNTSESIIPYNSEVYLYPHPDLTFYIPEGTTQLYVDKGYPLEKLVEGATSITLTSNKDIIGIGETAIITGTLDYPSQDKVVLFNTETPESVAMTPGDNYYSIGENGLDITDFNNAFYLKSNIDNGHYLYISYYGVNNGEKALNVTITEKDVRSFPPIINKITYPIRLHIDENNIIAYRYKDYERQEVICLVKNLPSYRYRYSVKYIKEEGFTQWQLSGENSLTVIKNTGLSTLTDSNGQATMEYEGVGAGDVTITGTYLDKNVSDSITITDTIPEPIIPDPSSISIQSNKTVISATNNESCILNATVLDENNNPVENQEVTFKLGTTILDTALTDENGEATYGFEAKGNGNISVSAEVGDLSSNSLTIEDCIYAKMQQYDIVRNGSSTVYGLLNDDIISDLPTQYSIELSMKTSMNPASGSEHRLYWVPRELYNNGSQPSYAMFLGFAYTQYIQYGVRRGSTSCVDRSCSIGSWYNLRVDKTSDRFTYYNNGSFIDWYSFGYKYNNWTFSYIIWSDTTLSVKDIKIKPFEFNGTISIEYSETETNYTLTATLTGNDIANRAVRFYKNNKYIGTSFTNSNGIATKTFDEIEDEDMSFTTWCGNVESSEVIVENDTSTPKIKLSADKNILSYADNDSCTLTATYKNADNVSGKSVVFKIGDTILDTVTTDSEGVATYEYESQGVGDVTFTIECMNLQKTFIVYDYWKYDSSVHSTESETVNWDLPSGDFEITAYIERGTGGAYIHLADSTTANRILFGHASSNSNFYLYCGSNNWNNGSGNNTDHTLKIINDVAYYTVNGNTISQSVPTGFTHKLYQFAPWGDSKISNIRIKSLPPFDGSLSVSTSKDILSHADNDSCTLTATLTGDNVTNRPVVFKNGNTVLDTVMTDNNGEAEYTYNSQGVGDVTITVECMNLQETFTIEDCKYFNDGSSIGSLSIGSGITCTCNGNYITISTNTSGEKYVNLPVNIMDGDEFSFELAEFGVTNDMAWQIYNGIAWGATTADTYVINLEDSASSYYDISRHIGQVLSIQYQNGICSVYFDGDLKKSKTVYLNNSDVGFYTNNGRVQHIKNIKLKPL